MSHITFQSGTVVPKEWLQDLDTLAYTYFGNGTGLTGNFAPVGNITLATGKTLSGTGGLAITGAATIGTSLGIGTTLTAPTSVVTPLIGTTTNTAVNLQFNNVVQLLFDGNQFIPNSDGTYNLGRNVNRWGTIFVTSVDTGTTGSGTLKTNNGTTVLTWANDLSTLLAGSLKFSSAVSKVVPGATSLSFRNNADNADNLIILDNGNVTIRGSLTVSGTFAGTLTAGTACTQNPFAISTKTTQAHGLGVTPTFIQTYMENLTAELNYSVGDRVFLQELSSTAGTFGWVVEFDSTNVNIITNPTGIDIPLKNSPFTYTAITAANWKVVAVPYKLN